MTATLKSDNLEATLGAEVYQSLTPGERACVSGKIAKLSDEGYDDPDQRVAIAIKHCAPSKSKSQSYAASMALPLAHARESLPDGKVILRDVPIFPEVTERQGEAQPFNVAWLWRALEAAQAKAGYWAPMHFHHHAPSGPDRERAGDLRPTAVRLVEVEGRMKWTLFADLRFDDADRCERALRAFPYRSVEVSADRPNEINSLALLSSEAPFHRLPNLAAFAATASGSSYTWRTKLMAKKTKAAQHATALEDAAKHETKATLAEAEAETETKDEGEGEGEGDEAKKDDGADFGHRLSKLEAAVGKLAEAMAMEADEMPTHKEEGSKTGGEKVGRSPVVAAEALATTKLEAERDALEDRIEAIEGERKRDAMLATFRAELEPYGLTSDRAKKLVTYLAKGEEHARVYVDTIKATVRKVPRAPVRPEAEAESDEPKELAAYAAAGPAVLAKARASAAVFAAMPPKLRGPVTLDKWLATDPQGPGPL